jgi:hypothetical protein
MRFQPRNLWPSEVSSKDDPDLLTLPNSDVIWDAILEDETIVFDTEAEAIAFAERNPGGERFENEVFYRRHPGTFMAATSPRGRCFRVRAQFEEDRYWDTDEIDPKTGQTIIWP